MTANKSKVRKTGKAAGTPGTRTVEVLKKAEAAYKKNGSKGSVRTAVQRAMKENKAYIKTGKRK